MPHTFSHVTGVGGGEFPVLQDGQAGDRVHPEEHHGHELVSLFDWLGRDCRNSEHELHRSWVCNRQYVGTRSRPRHHIEPTFGQPGVGM